jgi:predicted O-methyltransferase YrrM
LCYEVTPAAVHERQSHGGEQMDGEYRTDDWNAYRMDYGEPHRELEPPAREIEVVGGALAALRDVGALPHTDYDHEGMLAHRQAVRELFEIPWTAITPRMQRLLYAINAIARPGNMIAAGVFCGNTFISNAGAAVGPGACYTARNLIGLEIVPEEAERAERNVRRIDPTGVARVVAADAVDFVAEFPEPIHLLYLDADGPPQKGKGIYLDILQAGYGRMPPGALVLAHNSENSAERLAHYLDFVRDEANFSASVNVVFDIEGLEVSVR